MSQRQLAQQSGVDHSTISRLIRGDRMPSLGTATKLARGLREIRDDGEGPHYLWAVDTGTVNPSARVEYALRADDVLSEPQVRQVMEYYLAVRLRRVGRVYGGLRSDRGSVGSPRFLDDRRGASIIAEATAGRTVSRVAQPLPVRGRSSREAS
jgi:transcriptional regulator with XRE-family HTH domain